MTSGQKVIKGCAIGLAIMLIINIFSLILELFGGFWGIFFEENTSGDVTYSKVYDDIERIEIDGLSSFVTIGIGTEFKVEATDVDKNFKANLKNKTLSIEESKSWLGSNNDTGKIVITIPKNTILEELDIDTGASKFVIDGIEVKEFDIDHGAGLLEISNSNIYEADIDGGAGKISIINTTLNDLDLDSGVGKVELKANITGNSQISCGVGEVDVTLLGVKEDYKITVNKGIGNIKIAGVNQENGTVYGSGFNKLKIDGGVGSINIDFEENT